MSKRRSSSIEHIDNNTSIELSEYERTRLENIRRNQEYLSSIGLEGVKEDIHLEIEAKLKQKATQRGVKKLKTTALESQPLRRSGRVTLEKIKFEIESLNAAGNSVKLEEKKAELEALIVKRNEGSYEATINVPQEAEHRLAPEPIFFNKTAMNIDGDMEINLVANWLKEATTIVASTKGNRGKSTSTTTTASSSLSHLKMKEEDVAKVTVARITSVFLHPSVEKTIVFAGDKIGCVGMWDVDAPATLFNEGVVQYKPHIANVSKIDCWENDPSKVYSVSYDGTIRYTDVIRNAFVLGFEDPTPLWEVSYMDASFSYSHPGSIFLGRQDGYLGCVDLRASSTQYQFSHSIQQNRLNSVQQHPTEENLIICAGGGSGGAITIHDLRAVKKPLVVMDGHTKSINAAYASPDGSYIVSVSQDNTIRTWSHFNDNGNRNGSPTPTSTMIRHDNHTGRWLSTFRPAFDKKFPSRVIMGSMESPRKIELFYARETTSTSSKGASSSSSSYSLSSPELLRSEFLKSICSRNCFHPTRDIVAGANSSGRIHIFR